MLEHQHLPPHHWFCILYNVQLFLTVTTIYASTSYKRVHWKFELPKSFKKSARSWPIQQLHVDRIQPCIPSAIDTPYHSHQLWWSSCSCSTSSKLPQSRNDLALKVWNQILYDCLPRGQICLNGSLEHYISSLDHSINIASNIPTITAPTAGWSRTHRVAMFAMLNLPCRSPIRRKMTRRDWKSSQLPQAFLIMSRYCAPRR